MEFKRLSKVHAGKFIDRYDIVYETADGNDKVYEMISRDHDIDKAEDPFARLTRPHNDSVILVVTDETGERLLISKEYRMACGHWVYNFVWEETGLELYEIDDTLDKSIAAIGFSNEKNISIFGKARGEFRPSTSAEEEIIPGWYTKEEVRELLRTEYFAARTQAYCYLWSKE